MFGLRLRRPEERPVRAMMPRRELPFRMLREEFEPIFERLLGSLPFELPEPWVWPHGLTMAEAEKEYIVRAELPGFAPAEIEVYLRGNELVIEAKHMEPKEVTEGKEEKKPEEAGPYAHVRRAVMLPEGLELEKMEATYRNGVLEVRVPRLPEAVGRRIEVKT